MNNQLNHFGKVHVLTKYNASNFPVMQLFERYVRNSFSVGKEIQF